jgi:hypothetical protein
MSQGSEFPRGATRGERRDAWRRMPRQKLAPGIRRRVPWPLLNGMAEPKYQPVVGRSKYTGEMLRAIRADGKHR